MNYSVLQIQFLIRPLSSSLPVLRIKCLDLPLFLISEGDIHGKVPFYLTLAVFYIYQIIMVAG